MMRLQPIINIRRSLIKYSHNIPHLEVHPRIQGLHGPVTALQPCEAVDEVGAQGGVDVLGGELPHTRPVVGPGAPVADNLQVISM